MQGTELVLSIDLSYLKYVHRRGIIVSIQVMYMYIHCAQLTA